MISYDYLMATGGVPLIDFVGHSTGGVWSMMWANQHPHNVGNIFALGSPFNGSEVGHRIRVDWMQGVLSPYAVTWLIENPSSFDNTDIEKSIALRQGWNNAVAQNPNLRLHTVASTGCMIFLAGVGGWVSAIYGAALGSATLGLPGMLGAALLSSVVVGLTVGHYLVNYLIMSMEFVGSRWIFPDDVAVARTSAFAQGFSGVTSTKQIDYFVGGPHNTGLRSHPNMFPTPHNLLVKDSRVVAHIIANFSDFNYTIQNDEATITGFKTNRSIRSVVIPRYVNGETVTFIGDIAFANQALISRVTIPNTVTAIGASAFRNNGQLWVVDFEPGSRLTSIGNMAFDGCVGLGTVHLPHGVRSIGNLAFNRTDMVNFTLPASVNSVGIGAFNFLPYVNLTFTWHYNPNLSTETFWRHVTSVVIPEHITAISDGAFENMDRLTSITIPRNIRSIGNRAFARNFNLRTVWFESGSQLEFIGDEAFWACSNLFNIPIPASVTRIGKDAFWFSGIWSATPNNSVIYAGSGQNVWAVGAVGTVPNNTTLRADTVGIANGTFMNQAIPRLHILSGVRHFGINAFHNSTVTVWGHSFEFRGTTLTRYIGQNTVVDNIPNFITHIVHGAFANSSITQVTIPYSVFFISPGVFSTAQNLQNIWVEDGSNHFISYDGVLYESRNGIARTLFAFPASSNKTDILIPNTVTLIAERAFFGAIGLHTVTFEQGSFLSAIERSAFELSGLQSIDLYLTNWLSYIGDWAFMFADLTSVNVPASVEHIGIGAFGRNYNLTDFTFLRSLSIHKNITTIGGYIFADNTPSTVIIAQGDGVDVLKN